MSQPCELCFARPWGIQCSRSSPRPENSYREAAIQVDRRPQKATSGPVAAVQKQTVQVGVGREQIIGGRSLHHYSDGDMAHVGCAATLYFLRAEIDKCSTRVARLARPKKLFPGSGTTGLSIRTAANCCQITQFCCDVWLTSLAWGRPSGHGAARGDCA